MQSFYSPHLHLLRGTVLCCCLEERLPTNGAASLCSKRVQTCRQQLQRVSTTLPSE